MFCLNFLVDAYVHFIINLQNPIVSGNTGECKVEKFENLCSEC